MVEKRFNISEIQLRDLYNETMNKTENFQKIEPK